MLVCRWCGYLVVFKDACCQHFAQCIACEPTLWLASRCTVCSGSYLQVCSVSESFTLSLIQPYVLAEGGTKVACILLLPGLGG